MMTKTNRRVSHVVIAILVVKYLFDMYILFDEWVFVPMGSIEPSELYSIGGYLASESPFGLSSITSLITHLSLPHILFNCISLYYLSDFIDGMLYNFEYVALLYTSGIGGNILTHLIRGDTTLYVSAGISGSVYGLMGAIVVFVLMMRHKLDTKGLVFILGAIMIGMGISLLSTATNHLAHMGGLIAGGLFMFGIMIARNKENT